MMTGRDKVKQMTDDELIEVLGCHSCVYDLQTDCQDGDCKEGIKQWLDQEVDK